MDFQSCFFAAKNTNVNFFGAKSYLNVRCDDWAEQTRSIFSQKRYQDSSYSVKRRSGQPDNTIGPLNDIFDQKQLLVCQMPASNNKKEQDNDDVIVPRWLEKHLSLILLFMVTTLVLIMTLCILIVIAISWFTTKAQSLFKRRFRENADKCCSTN